VSSPLARATGLRRGQAVAAVGGGGKTSLLEALARECRAAGWAPVLLTTTTKIFAPEPQEEATLLLGEAQALRQALAARSGGWPGAVILARSRAGEAPVPGGGDARRMKLEGFGPAEAEGFRAAGGVLLIEADGARGLPIKAPGPGEPVVPPRADIVLGVVGLDALGAPLDEAHAFRADLLARLMNLPLGARIDPAAVGRLAAHPEGLFRGAPRGARKLLVLNKADALGRVENLEQIAYTVWEIAGFPRGPAEGALVTSCAPDKTRVIHQILAEGRGQENPPPSED